MSDPTGAAHLTGTIQTSPSLFELLSVENFSSALHSAVHHVVKFCATRSPETFGAFYRNFDELFLLLDAALQLQYLKTRRATLGEAFYGLERKNLKGEKLNIVPSLLTSILVPYAKCKVKKIYDEIRQNGSTEKWKQLFVKLYPVLLAVLGTLKLYKYIRYCLGYSPSHDIILHLLGLQVGYAQPSQQSLTRPTKPLKWFLLTVGESVLWVIEIGAFFVQFLEAFTNKRGSLSSLSLPIPEYYHGSLSLDKTKCPLCHEKRRNAAALSTSGVVYCYSCIVKYLRTFPHCPVTQIPSTTEHITCLVRGEYCNNTFRHTTCISFKMSPNSSLNSSDFRISWFLCCVPVTPPVRQRRKIDRTMIGQPTDFRHTAHLGTDDLMDKPGHLDLLQAQMSSKSLMLPVRSDDHSNHYSSHDFI